MTVRVKVMLMVMVDDATSNNVFGYVSITVHSNVQDTLNSKKNLVQVTTRGHSLKRGNGEGKVANPSATCRASCCAESFEVTLQESLAPTLT